MTKKAFDQIRQGVNEALADEELKAACEYVGARLHDLRADIVMAADPDIIGTGIGLHKLVGPDVRRMIFELRDAMKAIDEQYSAEFRKHCPDWDDELPF